MRLSTITTTLFYLTIACKSKNNRIEEKKRNIECNFTNITTVHISNTYVGGLENTILPKKLIYFKAQKPNIAILPCYETDVKFFKSEPKDNPNARIWSELANNPSQCQAIGQATKICEYFTYKLDSNRCSFFSQGLEY